MARGNELHENIQGARQPETQTKNHDIWKEAKSILFLESECDPFRKSVEKYGNSSQ